MILYKVHVSHTLSGLLTLTYNPHFLTYVFTIPSISTLI